MQLTPLRLNRTNQLSGLGASERELFLLADSLAADPFPTATIIFEALRPLSVDDREIVIERFLLSGGSVTLLAGARKLLAGNTANAGNTADAGMSTAAKVAIGVAGAGILFFILKR